MSIEPYKQSALQENRNGNDNYNPVYFIMRCDNNRGASCTVFNPSYQRSANIFRFCNNV